MNESPPGAQSVSERRPSAAYVRYRRKLLPRRSAHVRVAVVGRRHERLLDRARRHPAHQVEDRAGLVVGAAGPRAAERLLADDRAGGLVVDVEVARREPQRARSPAAIAARSWAMIEPVSAYGATSPPARAPRRSRRRRRRARPGSGRSTRCVKISSVGSVHSRTVGPDEVALASSSVPPASTLDPAGDLARSIAVGVLGERAVVDDGAHEVRQVRRRRPWSATSTVGDEVVAHPVARPTRGT